MNHPFKVGEVYRNRFGTYEVTHIDDKKGTMLVRYLHTGEEAELTIPLQARIWRNMSWDEQEAIRQQAAEEARYQQGYGDDFTGLLPSDFKTNTEGTTWRSRRSLAGRVAKLLSDASSDPPYTFVSWAIYRWPVAFLTHREDYEMAAYKMGVRKAKLTIELDDQNAYYGLYVERGNENIDHTWDWIRLQRALQEQQSLQDLITAVEADHDVRFLVRTASGTETYHFADALEKGAVPLWNEHGLSALSVQERLQRLEELSDDQWIEFYLIAATPKAEALKAGVRIAQTMADVMASMLPIYTAATRG